MDVTGLESEAGVGAGHTAKQLEDANREEKTVGIATASHGGCGPSRSSLTGPPGYVTFNIDVSGKWVGVFKEALPEEPGTGFVSLVKVHERDKFVAAYFGHCYYEWWLGKVNVWGSRFYCEVMYSEALGVDLEKVHTPEGLTGAPSDWDILVEDFKMFWYSFPHECPLMYEE